MCHGASIRGPSRDRGVGGERTCQHSSVSSHRIPLEGWIDAQMGNEMKKQMTVTWQSSRRRQLKKKRPGQSFSRDPGSYQRCAAATDGGAEAPTSCS